MLVMDQGKCYCQGVFAHRVQLDGTEVVVTSARSPWQNGAIERRGGVWKTVHEKVRQEVPLENDDDEEEAIDATTVACNEGYRGDGYSVYSRVFGKGLRLAEGATGKDKQLSMETAGALGLEAAVAKGVFMRQVARKAWVEADASARWKRVLHRTSQPQRQVEEGDRIYYWGPGPDNDSILRWRGPCQVIMVKMPGSIWASYRGGVVKVSPPNVRLETPEELASTDLSEGTVPDLRRTAQDLRGKMKLLDLTSLEPPPREAWPEQGDMPPALGGGAAPLLQRGGLEERAGQEPPNEQEGNAQAATTPRPAIGEQDPGTPVPPAQPELPEDPAGGVAGRPRDPALEPFEVKRRRYETTLPPVLAGSPPQDLLPEEPAAANPGDAEDGPTPAAVSEKARGARPRSRGKIFAPLSLVPGIAAEVFLSSRQQAKRKEVLWRHLPQKEREKLSAAMAKEWRNITELGAVEVLSGEEAGHVRGSGLTERVLKSRWVLTEKEKKKSEGAQPEDPCRLSGERIAKARWVVLGHTNPDLS